ncbi:hypothetical protein P691DRAFT_86190 [Macrolepiota fuliginosa MF-IS2]|uniref:Uncharacterized protein n=1 Tax=Macrolepiota fuliginosa MF-IS2 TaxID=1400762 RepID=A0A9P5XDN2_9AGAR|nr:hypothetical protein P691DRAFT_86190 [Macrolepiota fuliginosa MF-IS2]
MSEVPTCLPWLLISQTSYSCIPQHVFLSCPIPPPHPPPSSISPAHSASSIWCVILQILPTSRQFTLQKQYEKPNDGRHLSRI